MTYNVKYTDSSKLPITISDDTVNTATDIALFGRNELNYGQDMNENLLHILENFACPEDTDIPGTPDLTSVNYLAETTKLLLTTPVTGQIWFNKTQQTIYFWDTTWRPISLKGDIGINWGTICDGGQLPRPTNSSGYSFSYDECVWIVSPTTVDFEFDYILCSTDTTANVTMRYGNGGSFVAGTTSYMIVGIRGNVNLGTNIPIMIPSPTPTPSVTSTNTPTPTPTVSVTATPGATPTPTPTPTPSVTPTHTPTPTPSPIPPLAISLLQGDGTAYSSGMIMYANATEDLGQCGGTKYQPGSYENSFIVGILPSGGVAPYAVTLHNWVVTDVNTDAGDEGTDMGSEGFAAYPLAGGTGSYWTSSSGRVDASTLSTRVWTWNGHTVPGGSPITGYIQFSGTGDCKTLAGPGSFVAISGTVICTVVDHVGNTLNQTIAWTDERTYG